MTAILFVKNCTPWYPSPITIEILREAFEVYGPINRIKRKSRWGNGNIRSALIYFESMENAEEARSHLDGKPLYGAYLEVSHDSTPPKSARGKDVRVPSEQVAADPVQDHIIQLSPARATTKGWNVTLQGGKFLFNEMVAAVPVEKRILVDNLWKLSDNFDMYPIFF